MYPFTFSAVTFITPGFCQNNAGLQQCAATLTKLHLVNVGNDQPGRRRIDLTAFQALTDLEIVDTRTAFEIVPPNPSNVVNLTISLPSLDWNTWFDEWYTTPQVNLRKIDWLIQPLIQPPQHHTHLLWMAMVLQHAPPQFAHNKLQNAFPNLQELAFRMQPMADTGAGSFESLLSILTCHGSKLRRLHFEHNDLTNHHVARLLHACRNLTHLRLRSSK